MNKQTKALKKSGAPAERNLLVWLAVSLASWAVYVTGGGALVGVWADITIVVVAVWIFRYIWQLRKPQKGWNAPSIKACLIATLLCFLWLLVLGVVYSLLPKSPYLS